MTFYKPITDINELKKLFSDRQFDEKILYGGYIAIENDEKVGNILICIRGYNAEIIDISAGCDQLLAEGLIRAALNFAGNRNAYTARCFCEYYKDVLELLGFSKENGIYEGEIPELLKGSCCK